MDICIGGPWHGSVVLPAKTQKKHFKVTDSFGKSILYKRKLIIVGSRYLKFWLDSNLSNDQVNDLLVSIIHKYINGT